jgi:carbamate kinase
MTTSEEFSMSTPRRPRIVVTLGNAALLGSEDDSYPRIERRHIRSAAIALAPLAEEHELIICPAVAPQLDQLLSESEADHALVRPYSLDTLVAQAQGVTGYWLAQELRNAGVINPVASLTTRTVVDASDPTFDAPNALIGPAFHKHHATRLGRELGWSMRDTSRGWRRVVAAPQPDRVPELATIRQLADSGHVVVCAGGGGIPVIEVDDGELVGVEGVVDNDLTAALIAQELGAEVLLLLTDVAAIMSGFGTPDERPISRLDSIGLRELDLPAATMGMKALAADRFVRATGHRAAVGSMDDALAVLTGRSGTSIHATPRTASLELPLPAVR